MKIEKLREMGKLPVHIAFIIDGNGRWAKKRGFERMIGHKFGFKHLQNTIDYVAKSGIKYMSVYCFSTENWNRPKPEVDGLMDIFKTSFKEDVLKCQENNIKVVSLAIRRALLQNFNKYGRKPPTRQRTIPDLC